MKMHLPVLVTDTNIWIDLDHGSLLVETFQLPYAFLTPDFARDELKRPHWTVLHQLGLDFHELDPVKVQELFQIRTMFRQLSVTDISAFLLARDLRAILLTGERLLSEVAQSNGVAVHGVLWVLDELVREVILRPPHAAQALQRMLAANARLPQGECERRFSIWTRG